MGAHAIEPESGTLTLGGAIVGGDGAELLELAVRVFRVNAAARRVREQRPTGTEISRVVREIAAVERDVDAVLPTIAGREAAAMVYGWVTTLERARRSLESL